MTGDEALAVIEQLLESSQLNKVQEIVFRQSWAKQSYMQIAKAFDYDYGYIKDIGAALWQRLSQTLDQKVTKHNLQVVLSRYVQQRDAQQPKRLQHSHRQDWGESIDVSVFYGRAQECQVLEQWLIKDQCRLVALLGMGGIGKTSLSIKVAQGVQNSFDQVIWRSLLNAPSITDLLADVIQSLSAQPDLRPSETPEAKISNLLVYLRQHRCLLLFDNVESILRRGVPVGEYLPGYEDYGTLFKKLGETTHQSCLMLTSREKTRELALLESPQAPVRSLLLQGLMPIDAQSLLTDKGCVIENPQELQTVFEHYGGNPLALKIVASAVQDVLGGDLHAFMAYIQSGQLQFTDINDVLDRQFERLSDQEQRVMYGLAINREPISLVNLAIDLQPESNLRYPQTLLEVMQGFRRRCLVECSATEWFLQPVVMEYVTAHLIHQVCEEIVMVRPKVLSQHPLMKVQSKEYIRQTQIRLILKPLLERLQTMLTTPEQMGEFLKALMPQMQQTVLAPGYAPGNILNLLKTLGSDLSNLNCANLPIWQADFVGRSLPGVDFSQVSFANCAFTQPFSAVLCVAFSPDGTILAASNANGEIQLWQLSDGQCLLTYQGHRNWIRSIAFSPDGKFLVSTSDDCSVKLWNVKTGTCLRTFCTEGYTITASFSPDGRSLATAHADRIVRVWDLNSWACLVELRGHQHWANWVAFSPDSQRIASSSADSTVRVWDIASQQCLHELKGHQNWVFPVSYSPDGQLILSGGLDCTLRLWDAHQGTCLQVLKGHEGWIWGAQFSLDGTQIVSTGIDKTIRIWDVRSGECQQVIQGHQDQVWSIARHPNGIQIATGSEDHTIRLWDLRDGQCLQVIQGSMNWVRGLVFGSRHELISAHKDGRVRVWDLEQKRCLLELAGHDQSVRAVVCHPTEPVIISGGDDQSIKVWRRDTAPPTCSHTLGGHQEGVCALACSPNGQWLASAGCDGSIRLWHPLQNECIAVLMGHQDRVLALAFSPCGQYVASASEDQTAKVWRIADGICTQTFAEHTNRVVAIAFHPNGHQLASGGMDSLIRLWTLDGSSQTFAGHTGWILSLAYSSCGRWLVSGGSDRMVKVWDVEKGICVHTLSEHKDWVWAVAVHPQDNVIASAGSDEVIRLWDLQSGQCLSRLRADRLYEGMNITGAQGLTQAQTENLKLLGAIEVSRPQPPAPQESLTVNLMDYKKRRKSQKVDQQ